MSDPRKTSHERSSGREPGANKSRQGRIVSAELRPAFESFLVELSQALSVVPVDNLKTEISRWLEQLAREMGAERCSVGEFYGAEDEPRFLVHWKLGEQAERFMPNGRVWIQRQLSTGRVVSIARLDDMPAEAEALREEFEARGVRSGLWVPMVVQGETVGAIGLTTLSHERNWPDPVVDRCRLVGHVMGGALLRRRETGEIEERARFEELVTDISSRLMNVDGDVYALTDVVLRELGQFLKMDRVTYLEVDAEQPRIVPIRQWAAEAISDAESVMNMDVSLRFPWLTEKITGDEQIVVDNMPQFPPEAAPERQYCEHIGIRSFTMVPATLGHSVVAALALDSIHEPLLWSDRILRRLRIVADMIASAQARATAKHELEELRRFETAISRISTDFVNLPPDEVDAKIEVGLKLIATTLDVDLITLLQPRPDDYRVTHEWVSEKLEGEGFKNVHVDDDFPWLIDQLKHDQPIAIRSLSDFPDEASIERAAMIEEGLAAALWVPFKIRGELAGHLAINSVKPRAWSDELVPRLRLIGEVFGEALHRRDAELALQESFRKIESLKEQLQRENLYLRQEAKLNQNFGDIIGDSATLRAALNKVEQVAATDSTVLILGETGTGKELLARAIHNLSNRKDKLMVKVNCAALPASLVEAELFGREKGAYTGSLARELGRFEIADGSTILLDEIGELPLDLQAKLLRVLEDGEFERLGSSTTRKVNVRVLAATNRDLAQAVKDKEFREDLYYRINVFPIEVPPLRKHIEDIPPLVWSFVQEFSEVMGKTIDTIPRATMDALNAYSWPGNVRELRNAIERAMIVSPGPKLDIEVPIVAVSENDTVSSNRLEDIEREHIQTILDSAGWRIRGEGGAAEILAIKPTTLEARMKKLGLERSDT